MYNLLLTGATGFLGESLLPLLQSDEIIDKIYLLVRPHSRSKAILLANKFNKVIIVKGDITKPEVFLDDVNTEFLQTIHIVIHLAAFYDLTAGNAECFMQNVVGTQNILNICRKCPSLKQFHYASTIAIAGDFSGELDEKQLDVGQSFKDSYSRTKFEAEVLVQEEFKKKNIHIGCQARIYRLGILVGNSEDGDFKTINGPYYFLHYLSTLNKLKPILGRLPIIPLPFNEKSDFPLIPVDFAAKIIAAGVSLQNSETNIQTYHLTLAHPISVGQFLRDALRSFGLGIEIKAVGENAFNKYILKGLGIPSELLGYVYSKVKFKQANLHKDFPCSLEFEYDKFKEKFYAAAFRMFLKK